MARDRESYEAVLQAVGLCIAARIPFLLWGDPGAGKTAVIESAAGSGWHVETLICSHYEPSDFAGLPVVNGDRVTLAPPGWAVRVAEEPSPSIVFFDEWTTASPAVQAAALRPLTHSQVGVLQLPERVSFGAGEPGRCCRLGLGVGAADGEPLRPLRLVPAPGRVHRVDRDRRLAGAAGA